MAWGVSQGGQWEGGLFNRGSQEGLMLSPQSKFEVCIYNILTMVEVVIYWNLSKMVTVLRRPPL